MAHEDADLDALMAEAEQATAVEFQREKSWQRKKLRAGAYATSLMRKRRSSSKAEEDDVPDPLVEAGSGSDDDEAGSDGFLPTAQAGALPDSSEDSGQDDFPVEDFPGAEENDEDEDEDEDEEEVRAWARAHMRAPSTAATPQAPMSPPLPIPMLAARTRRPAFTSVSSLPPPHLGPTLDPRALGQRRVLLPTSAARAADG